MVPELRRTRPNSRALSYQCRRHLNLTAYFAWHQPVGPGNSTKATTVSFASRGPATAFRPNEKELSHRFGCEAALQLRVQKSKWTSTRNAKERLAGANGQM